MDNRAKESDFAYAAEQVRAVVNRLGSRDWNSIAKEAMEFSFDSNDTPKIIGIDTSVMLELAGNPTMLTGFQAWLDDQQDMGIILPMQVFQESWNNVNVIASKKKTPLGKLSDVIKEAKDFGYPDDCIEKLEAAESSIKIHDDSLLDREVAIENLRELFRYLLNRERAVLATFPRIDEAKMCDIRFGTKTPPGFEDVSKKGGAHYGDFVLWLDFLTGVVYAIEEYAIAGGGMVFLTNDRKSDWMVDESVAHPLLRFEAFMLTRMHLRVMRYADFKKEVMG